MYPVSEAVSVARVQMQARSVSVERIFDHLYVDRV